SARLVLVLLVDDQQVEAPRHALRDVGGERHAARAAAVSLPERRTAPVADVLLTRERTEFEWQPLSVEEGRVAVRAAEPAQRLAVPVIVHLAPAGLQPSHDCRPPAVG